MKAQLPEIFQNLIRRYPQLGPLSGGLSEALILLRDCAHASGKILLCGNGGSAADAEHIAGELMKSFLLPRPVPETARHSLKTSFPDQGGFLADSLQGAIPAIPLVSSVSLPTAYANDVAPVMVFAQQVYGLGRPGDVVWGLSTSGNSQNILYAFMTAKALGMKTLGMTGRDGGAMAGLCDVELRMPDDSTPVIQELHLPVYHALCAALEEELFG